jgi:large subunit ribosomal protein L17
MPYSHFDRAQGPRQALLRQQVVSLITQEKIVTTKAKAEATSRLAERLITLARQDTLAARRQARRFVLSEDVVKKLFTDLGPRFKDSAGGYTRIVQLGPRRGDAAPMVQLSLVRTAPSAKEGEGASAPGADKR